MKRSTKILSLILALALCIGMFAGCGNDTTTETPDDQTQTDTPAPTPDAPAVEAPENDTPLVVGYAPFSSKFSPFFAATAYDQDVASMTQAGLLTSDRTGAIILKGIEGETKNYNGTDYTYYGLADATITENADGTVFYDFVLRDDAKFADGHVVDVDDVIFSMYVLCDPTYDGSSTLYAQPILGMEAYRSGMEPRQNLILATERAATAVNNAFGSTESAEWKALIATKPTWTFSLV